MPSKKQISLPPEDEFMDEMMMGEEGLEEDIFHTFQEIADACMRHMGAAIDLTQLIVTAQKNRELSPDDILNIFRKCADTILNCTPLKMLFEKPNYN
jgi:hypothetical protein